MAHEWIVFAGVAAQLVGISYYVRETLRGNTKPNRVTWLMWAAAPMIGALAAFADGVRWPALPVFMAGFGPLLVFISSFVNPKAYWRLERFDYLCGISSVLALIFWGVTREPAIAILFAIASDGFAAVPTLAKLWRFPETETVHPYVTGLFASLTSIAAITVWGFSAYAFPVYLMTINILLIFAFFRRRIFAAG